MASHSQIEANRRNSQKSTGPKTTAGKAVASSNALKTGLYAEALLIRGEDPDTLDTVAREYAVSCYPIGPREQAAVDALVHADWLLRRLRRVETLMWNDKLDALRASEDDYDPDLAPLWAWYRAEEHLDRLQRRLSALDRSYHRALADLQRLQAHRRPADPDSQSATPDPAPAIGFVPSPAPLPPAAAATPAPATPAPHPQIGFVPSPAPRPPLPAPDPPSFPPHWGISRNLNRCKIQQAPKITT